MNPFAYLKLDILSQRPYHSFFITTSNQNLCVFFRNEGLLKILWIIDLAVTLPLNIFQNFAIPFSSVYPKI